MERVRLSKHTTTPRQRFQAQIEKRKAAKLEDQERRRADMAKTAHRHRVEVEAQKLPRQPRPQRKPDEVIDFDRLAERNRLKEKVAKGLILENVAIKTSNRLYRALLVRSAGDKEWGIVQAHSYNRGASQAMLSEHDGDLRHNMRNWMNSGYFGMGAQFKIDTVPAPNTERVY